MDDIRRTVESDREFSPEFLARLARKERLLAAALAAFYVALFALMLWRRLGG